MRQVLNTDNPCIKRKIQFILNPLPHSLPGRIQFWQWTSALENVCLGSPFATVSGLCGHKTWMMPLKGWFADVFIARRPFQKMFGLQAIISRKIISILYIAQIYVLFGGGREVTHALTKWHLWCVCSTYSKSAALFFDHEFILVILIAFYTPFL